MIFEKIRTDIHELATWNSSPTFFGKIKLVFDSGFHAVMTYRLGSFASNLKIPIVKQFMLVIHFILHNFVHMTSGIDISKDAKIGKGLVIHSYTGCLISKVEMGDYCVLAPNVFIAGRKGGLPKIGNHVFFGIGCKVIGNITIGDNANIGANAVIIKDVPANHTAVGVYPLKIFPTKNPTKDKRRNV